MVASPKPAELAALPESRQVRLDVRDDIRQGREPFARIMAAVNHARRPMLLYPQLDDRGFVHDTDEPELGLVRIVIRRRGGAA